MHNAVALRADHIFLARNSFLNVAWISDQLCSDFGNDAESVRANGKSNMINKLLGAATMAAAIYATGPAFAAHMGHMAGCSGENMTKTESMVEAMADGDSKMMAQKEIAMAQTAMLDGKMGACAMHLGHAMHAGMMK